MSDTTPASFGSTGVPALDTILGGGFCIGRLTQLRSSRWNEVAHVVEALRAAAPGPLVTIDFKRESCADVVDKIRDAAYANRRRSRVVYVVDPSTDPDNDVSEREMSGMARLLCARVSKDNTVAVVFLSRLTLRTGVTFGASEHEGDALKFYSSVRIDLQPRGAGAVLVRTLKNKLVPPFRSVTMHIVDGALAVKPDPTWQDADAAARAVILDTMRKHGCCTMAQATYLSAAAYSYVDVTQDHGPCEDRARGVFLQMVEDGTLLHVGYSAGHESYRVAGDEERPAGFEIAAALGRQVAQ